MLPVNENVVILHPLSPRERVFESGDGGGEFIESLRPAQEEKPGGRREAAGPGREKEHREHRCGNPGFRIQNNKNSNTTTKSLILAQDER